MKKGSRSMDDIWSNIQQFGLEILGLHYSMYRGFVINNEDPDGMGRLQLRIPQLNEFVDDSTWAFPKGIPGSKGNGQQWLPQKGDMVWVQFEYGNADYPVWSHAGYGETEKPTEFKNSKIYGFKTPNGNLITIDDNKGEESILVKFKSNKEYIKITEGVVELESTQIKLGKEGSENAVLGDTLNEKLDNILTKLDNLQQLIINHTHPSNSGPTGKPINSPEFINLKSELLDIKGSIPEILSNKVKID